MKNSVLPERNSILGQVPFNSSVAHLPIHHQNKDEKIVLSFDWMTK